jgi:P-type Ca2+ transporter type 2C
MITQARDSAHCGDLQKPPRKSSESLVTPWIFFRWCLIGAYVGAATVGIFVAWYMYDDVLGIDLSGDGHSLVTWQQLTDWEECPTWEGFTVRRCCYFTFKYCITFQTS